MDSKHYKNVVVTFASNGVMEVTASKKDMFGEYSISIKYGVCYVNHNGELVAASSNFSFKIV